MKLGVQIRNRRQRLRMSQQKLAEGRWSRSYISQLESGKIQPSLDTLNQIAERLDTTVSELVGDSVWLKLAKAFLFVPDKCRFYLEKLPQTSTTVFLEQLTNSLQTNAEISAPVPPNAELYYLAGRVFNHRGEYAQAAAILERGVKFADRFWRLLIYRHLMEAYEGLGDDEHTTAAREKLEALFEDIQTAEDLRDLVHRELRTESDASRAMELAELLAKIDWAEDFTKAFHTVQPTSQPF